jgi:hypothetical protein
MDLHQGWPKCGSGIPIRTENGDRFLQREDIPHFGHILKRVKESLLNSAGIPKHVIDAIGKELPQDGLVSLHTLQSSFIVKADC